MSKPHDSRPGIQTGELLPLSEFVFRARISRTVWQAMRTQSEDIGHCFALRIGSKTFIDTNVFIEFLRATTRKKTLKSGGGAI